MKEDRENVNSMTKLLNNESGKKNINIVIIQNLIKNVSDLNKKAEKQQTKVDILEKNISSKKTGAIEAAVLKRKKKFM